LDAKGIGLSNARGKAMDFVKKASKMIATHYPERSYKIFVINVIHSLIPREMLLTMVLMMDVGHGW
jgi:hypothetical protein